MFSEALRILDENTVKYMIDELKQEIEEKDAACTQLEKEKREKDLAYERLEREKDLAYERLEREKNSEIQRLKALLSNKQR